MAEDGPTSSSSEDRSGWVKWIVEYIEDPQAHCLDLRAVRDNGLVLDTSDKHFGISDLSVWQPIFDALVGSEIITADFRNSALTNKMTYLAERLAGTKITKLNLAVCRLTNDDVLSLMAVLKDTLITELDISRNGFRLKNQEIHDFTDHLVKSRLKVLNLSNNVILPLEKQSALFRSLPATQITRLDLSFLLYTGEFSHPRRRVKVLNTLISELQYTNVTDLNLGWNELGNSLAKALSAVLESTKLEKIDLCHNQLTDFGVDLLAPPLALSKVTHLDLSGNLINGNNSLGENIKYTKLVELNLSNNKITSGRMFLGLNLLRDSVLSTLKLSYCRDDEMIHVPVRNLTLPELKFLDLSNNMLNLEHIAAVAEVLSNSKLTYLNLSGSRLSRECFNALGECLNCSTLRYINLRNAATTQDGVRGIASFIERTKGSTMVSVGLSCNYLDSDVGITQALAHTTFLQLDLSINNLKNDFSLSAEQLKCTAIIELNLNGNYIGDENIKILAKCLGQTNIIALDLRNNSITSLGAKSLAAALKNTKLRFLNLERNEIDDEGLESLAEHAERSCITHIYIEINPWNRTRIINRILWQNHKKLQRFSDLTKRLAFSTSDRHIFQLDREFLGVDIDAFIEDCLQLYKMVFQEPCIVGVIEQDKLISDLKNKCSTEECFSDVEFKLYVEDCELVYRKILAEPCPVQVIEREGASLFNKQILWLILEEFPRQFVSFVARVVEADVNQHISLLRRIEELELTALVELLLLNRPKYVVDETQDILHPYVYVLLHKYKQPICNLEIEPKGVEKIVKYFKEHSDMECASEVVSLLTSRPSP